MKNIERITRDGDIMNFQKYARKDLKSVIDEYFEALNEAKDDPRFTSQDKALAYYFEDAALYWTLDDGTSGSLDSCGLDGKKPPVSRIVGLYESGYGMYVGFFGKNAHIEQHPKYGDWEVVGI